MIAHNVGSVRSRIVQACSRAGRDPGSVSIVGVTKGRSSTEIREVVAAGIQRIGESRIQDAREKYAVLGRICGWHLIGHLQTNKAKDAVKIFDCIHSVDSLRLAREIDLQARRIAKIQDVLIEVNTSGERSKYGIAPAELEGIFSGIEVLANVRVRGLMCVAPVSDDPSTARPYFRLLRAARDGLNAGLQAEQRLAELSMGMTDDFEVAVEEGATLVRIGRALFSGG
jgi:PLP dependent protein